MKQQTSAATETGIKGKNIFDFSGKTLCVGIDVHQKDWQVATVHQEICLGNHRMEANSEKLIRHLHNRYPGAAFKCVYESSAWGFTLQRQLRNTEKMFATYNISHNRLHILAETTTWRDRRR